METIIAISVIIFGIFQIILLVKIWGMTNDVREIKKKYMATDYSDRVFSKREESMHEEHCPEYATFSSNKNLNIGDLVRNITTGKEMVISSVTDDGRYKCYTGGGFVHVLKESEIDLLKKRE